MLVSITGIKKFAVHDGDGIRTTVFFKGCTLKCKWCHNPETISFLPQIGYYSHKCILCGACADICENHKIIDGKHIFDRKNCTACKKCVKVCLPHALEFYGENADTDEIIKILFEDKEFYEASGGGITISGGECLMQPEACSVILKRMKNGGINTAVDTCGMVPFENIEKVIDYTDVFLYDIKAIDDSVHKKCTGSSNKIILQNLKKIDEYGKSIEIRIPFVPDYNDQEIEKIAYFISNLNNIVKIRILPYHDYAHSKYSAIDMQDTLPCKIPDFESIENAKKTFLKYGVLCPIL